MNSLPALNALKSSRLQRGGETDVDAPSTLFQRGVEKLYPWRIIIEQFIEPKYRRDPRFGLVYTVKITVMGGVLSKHRDMVKALDAKFDPVFAAGGFEEMAKSGLALHKCSNPKDSTIEWLYCKPWIGMMPPGGVPPNNEIPGGSSYEFLKLSLGQSVKLNESVYAWTTAQGIPDLARRSEWVLTRTNEVGEEYLGQVGQLRRALGLGEYPSLR